MTARLTSHVISRRSFGLLGLSLASNACTCTCRDSTQQLTSVGSTSIERVDFHVHLAPGATSRLVALMDQNHIEYAVNLSGGHSGAGLEQQLAEAAATRGRIIVFTTLAYSEAKFADYGERMASHLRRAHSLGARGLKIAKLLGLGLRGPTGELLGVDDSELDVVFDTAGELSMPISIHTGDPLAFWAAPTPANERYAELSAHPGWSLHGRRVPPFDELYAQLERRVARHPRTTFISVHFGNCAEEPDRVANSLRRFPNLYIDTAARIPELGRHDPQRVQDFFEEFQDRILFGTDLGVGPEPAPLFLGSSGPTPPTDADREHFFASSWRYFESRDTHFPHPTPIQGDWTISGIGLPRTILEKVYRQNALRLLGMNT